VHDGLRGQAVSRARVTRVRSRSARLGLLAALSCACSSPHRPSDAARPAADPAATPAPAAVVYLSPTDHLVRASMTLRGKRPSVAELRLVQKDPSALPAIVDDYLDSDEFGLTIRELHNEAILTETDILSFPAGYPALAPIADVAVGRIDRSLQEAALRLIEYVVLNDRPYTEIVTADYTLVNGVVAAVWGGIPYDGDGVEWKVSRWTDGRDNAGILSDDWLFSRHGSTISNANRGRANAISKALLCTDFLDREIKIDTTVDLADPDVVANAVVENPVCAGCHQTLDPLASYFGSYTPIYVPPATKTYPIRHYMPNFFKQIGVKLREPSYFGEKGAKGGLKDLGALIAKDPRFSLCAAKRFYAYLNHVELPDVPPDAARKLQRTFEDAGMNAKALARAIVLSDDFRVAGERRARPGEIGRAVEDLTGFRWTIDAPLKAGQVDLMEDSFFGFKVLGGGIDAYYVTKSTPTTNATSSLVLRELAAEAARFVVDADLASPAPQTPRLLSIAPDETGEGAVRAALASLYLRLYGETVDAGGSEVQGAWTVFSGALDLGDDARRAWMTTLTAMLQDVRIAHY
jgi:hypothetical protein